MSWAPTWCPAPTTRSPATSATAAATRTLGPRLPPGLRAGHGRISGVFRLHGNDLSTPQPAHRFAGLKPGNRWCLCANRWREALEAGFAPPVILESTHSKALEFVTLAQLEKHRFLGAVH
jgi:hypothetical protein